MRGCAFILSKSSALVSFVLIQLKILSSSLSVGFKTNQLDIHRGKTLFIEFIVLLDPGLTPNPLAHLAVTFAGAIMQNEAGEYVDMYIPRKW